MDRITGRPCAAMSRSIGVLVRSPDDTLNQRIASSARTRGLGVDVGGEEGDRTLRAVHRQFSKIGVGGLEGAQQLELGSSLPVLRCW